MALAWNICAPLGTLSTFFQPSFQLSTAKNEINLFNNHVLIVSPVTFAPAGAMTPSAEFLSIKSGNPAHTERKKQHSGQNLFSNIVYLGSFNST